MARTYATVVQDLQKAQARVVALQQELSSFQIPTVSNVAETSPSKTSLTLADYKRYSRQLILPSVGLSGQIRLKNAHVLVVGAGGLGCPVLLYLAAAGVGEITILDGDRVDMSNLHRQVLHCEETVGWFKVDSARKALESINSAIKINSFNKRFIPSLFDPADSAHRPSEVNYAFSLILDCTDNPSTRHFLNAFSSLHRIPLVSGGAVRTDGTVGVFNVHAPPPADQSEMGPCYACVFPHVPPKSDVTPEELALMGSGNCEDEGVLGVLCGVVGLGMASEALRVLLGLGKPTLHLYSPLSSSSPYRTIKLRGRKPSCPTCSDPSAAFRSFLSSDNDESCALPTRSRMIGHGIAAEELKALLEIGERVKVVDTRSETEFGICSIPGSINIPLRKILHDPSSLLSSPAFPPSSSPDQSSTETQTVFVCRRGNDSVLAAHALRQAGAGDEKIRDLVGGLEFGWAKLRGQGEFPIY